MKFRHTFLILSFFLSLFASAQQKEVDSLYSILKGGHHDTSIANAYVMIPEYIGYTYPDTVIPLSKKAIEIAERNAPYASPQEKKVFRRIKAHAYNNIGLIYMNQGDISLALDNYYKCLELMEENNDKPGIVLSLNNIGGVFRMQGDNLEALDYYMRAYKLAKAIGDKDGTAFSLGNIGVINGNEGRIEQAIIYYKRSLEIRREINDLSGSAMSLNNIGFMYAKKDQNDTALKYYEESLTKWKELNDKEGMAYTLVNIGNVYFRLKDLEKAKKYAEESFRLAKEIDFPEDIREAAELLHKIYKEQKNWKMAMEMQDLFITMKDSISNEESKKTAMRKQMQYQYEKEKLALEKEQEKKDLLRNEEKQRQKIITWSVAGVLILVLVFSAFLYNRFHVIRSQKGIIEQQKHIVEEKQKEIIDSIHYAKRIQSTLLAGDDLLKKNLRDCFVLYKPKDIVSGDFYWAAEKDFRFYLAVCDSTGHGVPGAFMSLLNVSFLNEAISEKGIVKCNEILNYVRNRLIENVSQDGAQDGMDGILLCIEKRGGAVFVSYSAAYNKPVMITSNKLVMLPADKMPIGKGEKDLSFTEHKIEAKTGDMLYLFTDGYADQFGLSLEGWEALEKSTGDKQGIVAGKKFKFRQLNDLLGKIHTQDTDDQKAALELAFMHWKGSIEQVDDVCIVGLRL